MAEPAKPADFQQGVSTAVIAGMVMASLPENDGLSGRELMTKLREGLENLAYAHAGEKWRPVLVAGSSPTYDDYGCPNDDWGRSDTVKWLDRGWDAGRAIQASVGNALDDGDVPWAVEVLSDSTRLSPAAAQRAIKDWAKARFRS